MCVDIKLSNILSCDEFFSFTRIVEDNKGFISETGKVTKTSNVMPNILISAKDCYNYLN